MLPCLGAGAGQGIEDAYVLASLLGHPQSKARNLEVQ
jgi:salicylate hydroxylase